MNEQNVCIGKVWVFKDISDLEDREKKLSAANRSLERKVEERTKEIKIQMQKVTEADRLKSLFLANISHEIRTPINAIVGFGNIILGLKNEDKDKKEKYVNVIKDSALDLLNVITNLVDLSKIESGQLTGTPEKVNVNDLVKAIYKKFYYSAHKKGLELKLIENELVYLTIIQEFFEKSLVNVISNAIKFTNEGFVEIRLLKKPGIVRIEVEDSGGGIDEKYSKMIFERFRKTDENITNTSGGNGIGLTVAKAFVEKNKGNIYYESGAKGTTFYIDYF
jgi:signal transduction histidine kinase